MVGGKLLLREAPVNGRFDTRWPRVTNADWGIGMGQIMRFLLLAVVAAGFSIPAGAAGFDCAKAKAPMEKLICSDSGLSSADGTLAAAYSKLAAANAEYLPGLKDGQRIWLSQRGECLDSKQRSVQITCLSDHYRQRLAVLEGGELVACAKPRQTGNAFALACAALNNKLGLSFTLAGQKTDSDATLTKLSVAKTGGKPQDFAIDGTIPFDSLSTALELVDVNFDGFGDIKLTTQSSAGPNMGYGYWLYAPKAGQFEASTIGDQLSGFDIIPDPKSKTITATGRSSCCSWNSTTYGWSGNTLRTRSSSDTMSFSPASQLGLDASETLCGSQTKHFNDAGLLTRIDLELDSVTDFDPKGDNLCDKQQLTAQGGLLAKLKAKAKGYRLDAKDPYHFSLTFDLPQKNTD